MGGFTIETLVMAVSGYMIVKLVVNYFKDTFRKNEVIKAI